MKKHSNCAFIQTDEFDLFVSHPNQPHGRDEKVGDLVESMKTHGFYKSMAILVVRNPDKTYTVVDGHRRLAAAKKLGIPVWIRVGESNDMQIIGLLNQGQKPWASKQWAQHWASQGLADYAELLEYSKKGIPVKQAGSMLIGQHSESGNCIDRLKDGSFRIKDRSIIDQIVAAIERLHKVNSEVKGTRFIDALNAFLKLDIFDPATLYTRIEANPKMLTKCANRQQMFELLEDIYNFRARERVSLAFPAAEMLKGRKLSFGRSDAT